VETPPLCPGDCSLHASLITLHLRNKQRYFRDESPLEQSSFLVSRQIIYHSGQWNTLADAISRRPDHELVAVTVLQNPPGTTTIRDMNQKDGYLRNIHNHFPVASEDEPPPSSVISVLMWVSIDPKTRLLLYIRDRPDHRLCIPRNSTLIRELLHELHDASFSVHAGAAEVYTDLRSSLLWSKMKQQIESYVSTRDLYQKSEPTIKDEKPNQT